MQELKRSGETKIKFDQGMFDNWFDKADENHDGQLLLEILWLLFHILLKNYGFGVKKGYKYIKYKHPS